MLNDGEFQKPPPFSSLQNPNKPKFEIKVNLSQGLLNSLKGNHSRYSANYRCILKRKVESDHWQKTRKCFDVFEEFGGIIGIRQWNQCFYSLALQSN